MVSREEVIWAYRLLLQRDPESDKIIEEKRLLCPSVASLIDGVLQSEEFRQNRHKSTTRLGPSDLDEFVKETDRLGPVGSRAVEDYWSGLTYEIETKVDESLSPYSEEYIAQQIAVYRELSGRDVDQQQNELSHFNLDEHVKAANPYAHQPPHVLAVHLARLSNVLMRSGLELGEHVLDMGCGWGLSSELFAYSGLRVTALDINPAFVELVGRRAELQKLPIRAVHGTFERIPDGIFDAAAYYECLHHAVKPWETLQTVSDALRPGGKLLLAGEPINNQWRSWGLRTDILSLYCIRKHGWFESGWSLPFLQDCIERCGFSIRYCNDEGGAVGWVVVAEKV